MHRPELAAGPSISAARLQTHKKSVFLETCIQKWHEMYLWTYHEGVENMKFAVLSFFCSVLNAI